MAVKFIKERKKQRYLIMAFAVILVIVGIVLWLGYFKKEKPVPPPDSAAPHYREVRINFEILENPFLKESQSFEKIPPFEDEKGRKNPFLPY